MMTNVNQAYNNISMQLMTENLGMGLWTRLHT